jgi:hypothetical protein
VNKMTPQDYCVLIGMTGFWLFMIALVFMSK